MRPDLPPVAFPPNYTAQYPKVRIDDARHGTTTELVYFRWRAGAHPSCRLLN